MARTCRLNDKLSGTLAGRRPARAAHRRLDALVEIRAADRRWAESRISQLFELMDEATEAAGLSVPEAMTAPPAAHPVWRNPKIRKAERIAALGLRVVRLVALTVAPCARSPPGRANGASCRRERVLSAFETTSA